VRTEQQSRIPLVLGGPGAGADITAAGVLSDVIAAAGEFRRS
jgi:aspartokinase/homoserine dehydrogenase 1